MRQHVRSQQSSLTEPAELVLAKKPHSIRRSPPHVLNDFRPNLLANYLYELANSFHGFYEACPVLKSEAPRAQLAPRLLPAHRAHLQRGLDLLGIEVPERM